MWGMCWGVWDWELRVRFSFFVSLFLILTSLSFTFTPPRSLQLYLSSSSSYLANTFPSLFTFLPSRPLAPTGGDESKAVDGEGPVRAEKEGDDDETVKRLTEQAEKIKLEQAKKQ